MFKKNILQEYLQARRLPLPIYEYMQSTDKSWTCTITLWNGERYVGSPALSKKEADLSAIDKVLLTINREQPIDNIVCNGKRNIVILLDVENKPNFLKIITVDILNKADVYAFVSKNTQGNNYIPSGVKQMISPSYKKDAADTFLQMYCTSLLMLEEYETYIIVTGDHFGSTLVDHIQADNMYWIPKKAYVIREEYELRSIL